MKKYLFALLACLSLNTFALTVDGINFPDTAVVEGKNLVLNGVGIRKATFLKIKVYYGGLYLEQKSKEITFINSTSPKQIIINFVREVTAKQLKETWVEGLERANTNYTTLKSSMDQLATHLVDVDKNDSIVVQFLTDGVVLTIKGKTTPKIGNADFSKGLLNVWFTKPQDENLREGLLGK